MSKIQFLTISQALAEGYKYCTPQNDEMDLIRIEECEFDRAYVLVGKETVPYRISDTLIKELVDDYLCNQEDVYDENAELNDIAQAVDYSKITEDLNKAFSVKRYYHPTNIRLSNNLR